jgi:sigma-B regulation protein RsbU (phosphoserine phosphatase)
MRRRGREDAQQHGRVLVATLHRSPLPPSLPDVPGLEAAAHYHFASPDEVAGDFYDLFRLRHDHLGLFLGDVCGKGAPAAAVTSLIRYTLRATAVYDSDPSAVLGTFNTALLQDSGHDSSRFCTAIFGLLSPKRRRLRADPGPPPLLIRGSGGRLHARDRDGLTVPYQHY